MRIQISFELLVYFALAGIAILSSLTFLASKWPEINGAVDRYGVSNFVSSINEAISDGIASFSVYVPTGICNSTADGDEIETVYGTFYFLRSVAFSGNSLCPDDEYTNLHVAYGQGYTLVISR